jgi:hypothetical protein
MCGGIRFPYDPTLATELAEIFTPERCEEFQRTGLIETLFWQSRPTLPYLEHGILRLADWGNRDPQLRLPQTGWVRIESLTEGKWAHLQPRSVTIPAVAGVEKKVWFGIDHGLQGVIVRHGEVERIYMQTMPPTAAYRTLTGHDRMPVLVNQAQILPLLRIEQQTELGI